jgi:hypothetical protein
VRIAGYKIVVSLPARHALHHGSDPVEDRAAGPVEECRAAPRPGRMCQADHCSEHGDNGGANSEAAHGGSDLRDTPKFRVNSSREGHMRKLIGYVAGAAFGIAFVATCGNMGGNSSGDGGSPFDIAGLDIAGADAMGGSGNPDYTSGSRIKQRVVSTSDGASGFAGWYDSQLNLPCSFLLASDQQMRCVPLQASIYPYFSDANCTQKLSLVSTAGGCPAPTFAYDTSNLPSCVTVNGQPQSTVWHVYTLTGTYTGTTFYQQVSPTNCMMLTGTTTPAGYAFYSVNPTEAPASMFAAGTYSVQ